MSAIERAVSIVGSQSKLGSDVGVTQVRVSQWCAGDPIPVRYWPLIQHATYGRVTVYELLGDELAKLETAQTQGRCN